MDLSKTDGLNTTSEEAAFIFPGSTFAGEDVFGSRLKYDSEYRTDFWEALLGYNKKIPAIKSKLQIVAGYSKQEDFRGSADEETSLDQQHLFTSNGLYYRINLNAFFGRLHYSFNQKYLLDFAFRREGTSRFIEENKWTNFPALSLGWIISQENFLKSSRILSDLKIRLGWGITGQENIQQNLDRVPISPIIIPPGSMISFDAVRGEKLNTYNFGVDFGFWNGRVSGSTDYFIHQSEDLLITLPHPSATGLVTLAFNSGTMENKGFELNLQANLIDQPEWQWNIGFNLTSINQKITNLSPTEGVNPSFLTGNISNSFFDQIQIYQTEEVPNAFYVLEQLYDNQSKPIDEAFVDHNQDGSIGAEDRVIKGNAHPDIIMGFSSSVSYKNLF